MSRAIYKRYRKIIKKKNKNLYLILIKQTTEKSKINCNTFSFIFVDFFLIKSCLLLCLKGFYLLSLSLSLTSFLSFFMILIIHIMSFVIEYKHNIEMHLCTSSNKFTTKIIIKKKRKNTQKKYLSLSMSVIP